MYNKDSAKLYFHVWKHIWLVFHGKPKSCIVGTEVCVEDKEDVFSSVKAYLDAFPQKTINRLGTTMQFRNILWLVTYFGQGKKITHLQLWMEKHKGSCFFLYFRLFIEFHLLYAHITCFPVHTSFHSCSLYFVHSHIQTNRIAQENDKVFTASIEEDIERCMLVLLFHIALFCISFIIYICVHLVYCIFITCIHSY